MPVGELKQLKILTVVEEFTRKCPANEDDPGFSANPQLCPDRHFNWFKFWALNKTTKGWCKCLFTIDSMPAAVTIRHENSIFITDTKIVQRALEIFSMNLCDDFVFVVKNKMSQSCVDRLSQPNLTGLLLELP